VAVLQPLVGPVSRITHNWIAAQRLKHLPNSRPLTSAECRDLAAHFSSQCLVSARIASVDQIPTPTFVRHIIDRFEFLQKRIQFDFSAASAMTLGECILVADPELSVELLFHELVHVEQYRILGMKGFARAYVQGVVDSNFVYEKIPLEAAAFALTARFSNGESFAVHDELLHSLTPSRGSRNTQNFINVSGNPK
jgi:hypothetical protein